jgi:hypothetical protein
VVGETERLSRGVVLLEETEALVHTIGGLRALRQVALTGWSVGVRERCQLPASVVDPRPVSSDDRFQLGPFVPLLV